MIQADRQSTFERAVASVAAALEARPVRRPTLFAANGSPLAPTSAYTYSRRAAKRDGSMKNWIPQKLYGNQAETLERETIAARAIDLANSDPNAAGLVDVFAYPVVGVGLTPHPTLDQESLGLDKESARILQNEQRAVWQEWSPWADAGARMDSGQMQFLMERQTVLFGEYFLLLHMLESPVRPYSLACQMVHPLRVKTPSDFAANPKIRDGIELGEFGEEVACYVKKTDALRSSDTSTNFLRIPAMTGHRYNYVHGIAMQDAEQVRGMSAFAAGMKFTRDMSDLLDSELVAAVTSAAIAMFIETGDENPWQLAENLGTTESVTGPDGTPRPVRYQQMDPGTIMYGESGQKPHLLAPNRPGTTFEMFIKTIMKALATSVGLPYVVAFRDVSETNYAGFRSAMLDAWRVFLCHRRRVGIAFQKIYTMLQEEAWLRGRLTIQNFYPQMAALTRCEWRGGPKGDIEPIKEIQADILAIQNNLKSRTQVIAERGFGDFRTVAEQLDEEQELLKEKGLPIGDTNPGSPPAEEKDGADQPKEE